MALWVSKPFVSRVIRKFQLEDTQRKPEDPQFLPFVQPVTDVDQLLRETKLSGTVTLAITGSGGVTCHTVPAGKRWKVLYWRLSKASGTFTFSDHIVFDDGGSNYMVIKVATASTLSLYSDKSFTIETGFTLRTDIAWTVNGNLESTLMYEEEDTY